ncbi:urease accessory protein [Actinopolyspora erythraea]|uniref:Urease accessory protein UreD n=1 Tax=Actinopolyspora erythraea TaxID=414996 RepID=A0A099D1U4_9ACTN|nr:urease accessory protein UreD [Actinopolyspora erythraea]ASU77777.1 urease accessory protein [Actinopolyspora erythraea]KGI79989.1 urease accessory protein ureD [Actinopolyspora erythraea]
MRSAASLTVELDGTGGSVVRGLRSAAPLTLVPRRRGTGAAGPAVVHLVGSATSPLGGDDLALRVRVGAGARLLLRGIAAALALPGHRPGGSRSAISIDVEEGGTVEYLPEPTVVTARAEHRAELAVRLARSARACCRETLVLGRSGESPGGLVTRTSLEREGKPLLRHTFEPGGERLRASHGHLGGARVLANEVVAWGRDPERPHSEPDWALLPLAGGGSLTTVLAPDAVTARRRLAEARAVHPASDELTPVETAG